MTGKTLNFILGGTQMRFEDTLYFYGIKPEAFVTNGTLDPAKIKRHNINELDQKSYFYCMDGVAITPTDDHPDTGTMVFDADNSNLIREPDSPESPSRRSTQELRRSVSRLISQATGDSIENIASISVQVIRHIVAEAQQKNEPINNINLLGFSRGGVIAKRVAALLQQDDELKHLPIHMFTQDSVPGPGQDGHADERPENVKTYIETLALAETLVGFEPSHYPKSDSDKAYAVLPLPGDHTTSFLAAKSIVKRLVGGEASGLYSNVYQRSELHEAVLTRRGALTGDDARYPYEHNIEKHKARFQSSYNKDNRNGSEALRTNINQYYRYLDGEVIPSVQTEGSYMASFAQNISWAVNQRQVSRALHNYTYDFLFMNDHHRVMFACAYPSIYRLFDGDQTLAFDDAIVDAVQSEVRSMPEATKKYLHQRLGFPVKDEEVNKDKLSIFLGVLHLRFDAPKFGTNLSNKAFAELFCFDTQFGLDIGVIYESQYNIAQHQKMLLQRKHSTLKCAIDKGGQYRNFISKHNELKNEIEQYLASIDKDIKNDNLVGIQEISCQLDNLTKVLDTVSNRNSSLIIKQQAASKFRQSAEFHSSAPSHKKYKRIAVCIGLLLGVLPGVVLMGCFAAADAYLRYNFSDTQKGFDTTSAALVKMTKSLAG